VLQDRLVEDIARRLGLNAPPQPAHGTQAPGAYDYYLQGRGYLHYSDKPENVENAISVFQRAISLDADFGLAYAGLGESYWMKYGITKDLQWVDLARSTCERAWHWMKPRQIPMCVWALLKTEWGSMRRPSTSSNAPSLTTRPISRPI
jgi:hypothetical protein